MSMESGQDKAATRTATTVSLDGSHLLTIFDENDKRVKIFLAAARLFANQGYAGTFG